MVGEVRDHRMMALRMTDQNPWKVSHVMIATGLSLNNNFYVLLYIRFLIVILTARSVL